MGRHAKSTLPNKFPILKADGDPRRCQRRHTHLTPMTTPGAADGPPPSKERPSDVPPRMEYTAKRISRLEGRWHLRGHQLSHDHLTPMRTPGAADCPLPSKDMTLDASPHRMYTSKQVSHLEGCWRRRGCRTCHKHLTPMRTQGAADGPPTNRERPSDVLLHREYVAKQVFVP